MSEADLYIGIMSGTSLDGIDVLAARFTPNFEIIASHSEPIPPKLKQQILRLTQPGNNEIDLMGETDVALGHLFSQAANTLIRSSNLSIEKIRAIGCHGQTIRHRPELNFTLQIGDANIIAEQTGITTVADFRRRDIAAGGQGAPLVPAFHQAMLHSTSIDRVLLNIGGMANLTYLPANSSSDILGFDTGPGNVLMDAWISTHQQRPYDTNGLWAASGNCNHKLLEQLLALHYFHEAPPKSTGREQFNLNWLQEQIQQFSISAQDIQATLLELTALSIANCINDHIPSKNFELLVCGGGSRNGKLMERISYLLPKATVDTTDHTGIDADWMEAAAFAWLAKQCLAGNTGNRTSVTGAKGERILGAIYQA